MTHMVASTTQADASEQSVVVRVCHSQRIVAARRKAPDDDLLVVDRLLSIDPVKDAGPLAVWTRRVLSEGRGVASAWNFCDDGCDTFLKPSLLPDRKLCAITVEPGDDQDARSR